MITFTGATATFLLGASGITTGSQPLSFISAASNTSTYTLSTGTTAQTWNIGSGGLSLGGTSGAVYVLGGTAALTKAGVGNLTVNAGTGTLTTLIIQSGSVLGNTAGQRIISNAAGSTVTFDGATALLRQSAVLGAATFTINAGGGTFQATNGNQSNSTTNLLNGAGAFTLDTTQLPALGTTQTNAGFSILGASTAYTGPITLKTGDAVNATPTSTRVIAGNANSFGDASSTNTLTINAANNAFDSLTVSSGINLAVGSLAGNSLAVISTAPTTSATALTSTLTVNQAGNSTYAGTFTRGATFTNGTTGVTTTGSFNLVKNGAGMLTLTGDSSAAWNKGAVTLNGGTVMAGANNVFGTAPVTVTLNGGNVASDVSGRILPNTFTGLTTASAIVPTGTLTLGALDASAGGVTFTLNATALIAITGQFTGTNDPGAIVLNLSGGFTKNTPVTIATFANAVGLDASDFALSASAAAQYSLTSVTINATSVQIILGNAAVPEPGTVAAMLCGGGLVAARLLRRRRA